MSLSPDRKQLLDELVESNVSLYALHKKHGFNTLTVRKYYPDYRVGLSGKESTLKLLQQNEKLINELAAERAPGGVIAEALDIQYETLSKFRPDLMWSRKEVAVFASSVSKLTRIIQKKTL